MKRNYHTIEKQGKGERKLAEFLVRNGQALLPMMELIEQSRMAIDELIDVMGRASLEAVLQLSAVQVAGAPQQGKARQAEIVWHGTQPGRVYLKERQLRVNKPRLRKKGRGANKEVAVPAYEAMQQDTVTGERMLEILLEWCFHAALQPSDSRDGRHGGCVAIDGEPGKHRSFRSRAAAVAGTALRRCRAVDHLHRWHALRGSMRAGRRGCGYSGLQTRAGAT